MCLPKANCAKAAETIKSSPEVLGAQPGLFSVLQDFLVFFISKDHRHHAWLSRGIGGFGDSNPQQGQAAALDAGGAQAVPCL